MVESLDAGDVQEIFVIIIWSVGFEVKTYLNGRFVGCRWSPGKHF